MQPPRGASAARTAPLTSLSQRRVQELLFRCLLYQGIQRRLPEKQWWVALLISSVMFGLWHWYVTKPQPQVGRWLEAAHAPTRKEHAVDISCCAKRELNVAAPDPDQGWWPWCAWHAYCAQATRGGVGPARPVHAAGLHQRLLVLPRVQIQRQQHPCRFARPQHDGHVVGGGSQVACPPAPPLACACAPWIHTHSCRRLAHGRTRTRHMHSCTYRAVRS